MKFKNVLLLSLVILIAATTVGRAVVFDTVPIVAKLVEQLSEMTKQLDVAKKISTATQDGIDAIGKVGQIRLPVLNLAKLTSQINQDLVCLKPDFSKLLPNISTYDALNWNSICESSASYKKALWLDPKSFSKLSLDAQTRAVNTVETRRESILSDAAEKGLAQADMTTKKVKITNRAIDDVETAAKSAENQNERLAAIAQAQIVTARAIAQQTLILAQMLKIQSAIAIKAGVSVMPRTIKQTPAQPGQGVGP